MGESIFPREDADDQSKIVEQCKTGHTEPGDKRQRQKPRTRAESKRGPTPLGDEEDSLVSRYFPLIKLELTFSRPLSSSDSDLEHTWSQHKKARTPSPETGSSAIGSSEKTAKSWNSDEPQMADQARDNQRGPEMTPSKHVDQSKAEPESDNQRILARTLTVPSRGNEYIGINRNHINGTMLEMNDLIDQVVRSLDPSEAIPMVLFQSPDAELQTLYLKVFGVGSWCEKRAYLKPSPSNHDLMKSLIAAWILTHVLEKQTPWRIDSASLTVPGTVWSYVQELLESKNVDFGHVIDRAAFLRVKDSKFQAQQVLEHANSLTDRMSMALLPHILGFPARQQTDPTWRKRMQTVIKRALLLRAEIEATPGIQFEWLWFESGASIGEEMNVLYAGATESSVVGLSILPGIMVWEGDNGLKRGTVARVVHSDQWEGH